MATLETQYKNFKINNPDSTFTFEEWKEDFGKKLEKGLKEVQYTFDGEKLYTKKQVKLYAEHCMMKLVTKYPNGEDNMGEISSYDLTRINKILNQEEV